MKKLLAVLLTLVMVSALAAGCGQGTGGSGSQPDIPDYPSGYESGTAGGETPEEPDIVIWQINTNTGIPTLVAELENPNPYPVDIDFNVEYYLGGELIKTSQDMYYNALAAGGTGAVWDTWEIPEYADDISITYTSLKESIYTPASMEVVKEEANQDSTTFGFKIEEGFENADMTVFFFSGDKIVELAAYTFFPTDDSFEYTSTVLEHYDSYKIFTNAYYYKH